VVDAEEALEFRDVQGVSVLCINVYWIEHYGFSDLQTVDSGVT
jgi:hypothetical protein